MSALRTSPIVFVARLCGLGLYSIFAAFTFAIGAPAKSFSKYIVIWIPFVVFLLAYWGLGTILARKLNATIWQVSNRFEHAYRLVVPLAGIVSIGFWPNNWPYPCMVAIGLMGFTIFEWQVHRKLSTAPDYLPKDWTR